MTAQDKAQAGLKLIEEAILQIIRDNRRPMQPTEVADALSLRWKLSDGKEPQGIAYVIMLRMAENGQLDKETGSHPTYTTKPASTH